MSPTPFRIVPAAVGAFLIPLLTSMAARAEDDAALVEFFEKKVRPVLVKNCYTCHSANTNAKGGLRVDDRGGLLRGGSSGPAVVPGNPEKSLLIQAVSHTGDVSTMPPKKPLTAEETADLTRWIKDGAAWPKTEIAVTKPNAKYDKLRQQHWAWQPLHASAIPPVKNESWPRSDIDRFILAKLEKEALAPVADADKSTLLRRVTYDLTGLQPTPEAMAAFLQDPSPDAFEKIVDRLLASPAYGERWGRHWLDVARYGESTGSGRNVPYPHAWRYRDYVIDAFNNDKPYDQFIREQIAGDLLPAASERERDEHVIATGFLALGVKDVNQRFEVRFVMDNIDEQIDTVTRAVLALTASCARCHDHKFDPIPTMDYYALAGIFHSTELCAGVRNKMGGGGMDYYDVTRLLRLGNEHLPDPREIEKIEQAKKALAEAKAELAALRGKPESTAAGTEGPPKMTLARQKVTKLQEQLLALTDPAAHGQAALGVREAKTVGDTEIRIRGEAEKLGPVAPRGFLSVVDVPQAPKINPNQSGRLELAVWLTDPRNPLTSRVMVNRVWRHLFGRGLVSSVDNFGVTGDVPSHPELLDYLAAQFIQGRWSAKALIRTVVLSRAYRLSSGEQVSRVAESADPGNRLIWRHLPRRLDAEEIRDAMLLAAGTLAPARSLASPAKDMKVMELQNNGPEATRLEREGRASRHRSVYLPLLRGLVPHALEVFDFAEQG
ncbi:MAG TPA: PSD1 and planctomycete cytochrome C domain-containing protein, partial [Planctomycetota bacterium]|nr:PSD1 and planctomycete cytochrome C domain-containing protein [Planctomycetota bacterium]